MKQDILQFGQNLSDSVVETRRYIHENPELSFKEFETAKYISSKLSEYGIDHKTGVAGTGLVGEIKGEKGTGKTIALRADIDALPILEQTKVPFASKNEGVMHACGHDFHTASLLGSLQVLQEFKSQFAGTVRFLFQPGEELLPGGASLMIKEGVLENPAIDAIYGQHVFPELEAGKVGFRPGMYMASTDEIYFTVKGKGGHGAMPHQNVDSVYVACQVVVALQSVVSRRANPIIPSVLSMGKIQGMGATNVIPGEVTIEGTFRTMNEEWRTEAHQLITEVAMQTAAAHGATCEVDIRKGYPFLKNDEALTIQAQQNAKELLGEENVIDLPIRLTAEDFAFYSQHAPACFYRVGVRNEAKGIVHGVHHPEFDIEESAFKTSVPLMAYLAMKQLEK